MDLTFPGGVRPGARPQSVSVLGRRILLTLAAFAALGAGVVPALGAIDAHSAPLTQAPFSQDGSKPATAQLADPAIGSGWTTASLPADR